MEYPRVSVSSYIGSPADKLQSILHHSPVSGQPKVCFELRCCNPAARIEELYHGLDLTYNNGNSCIFCHLSIRACFWHFIKDGFTFYNYEMPWLGVSR